jgi:PBP1b-binding outer membrane lipoprotein LpoB
MKKVIPFLIFTVIILFGCTDVFPQALMNMSKKKTTTMREVHLRDFTTHPAGAGSRQTEENMHL